MVPDHPFEVRLWLSGAVDLGEMLWLAVDEVAGRASSSASVDRISVGWLKRGGRTHDKKSRGVTYPESYITKYTTYAKKNWACQKRILDARLY